MKIFIRRYLNEIIGLTVLVLMAAALIEGQAHTGYEHAAVEEARALIEISLTIAE